MLRPDIFNSAIQKRLTDAVKMIKAEQRRQRKYASGKSARSLRVVMWNGRGAVQGMSYFLQQETGVGPQQGPMPGWFVVHIKWWMVQKGVPKASAEQKAGAVANSIWVKGTRLWRGLEEPLGVPLIAEVQADLLMKDVAKIAMDNFTKFVVDAVSYGKTGDSVTIKKRN